MFDATPLLRLYARYRLGVLSRQDPASTQTRTLLQLTTRAANTRFGKAHNFHSIRSVADYQRAVPLRTYEDFWKEYFQGDFPRLIDNTWPGQISYFCVSSGTTSGKTKYIPYTKEMERSNTKAGLDLLSHHVGARPQSKIFAGKSFILGGSTDLVEEAPGIFSGDLSGIAVKTLPWWARLRYFPPQKLALLKNWEEKVDILARTSLQENIHMISGVPSWLLIFAEKLKSIQPESQGQFAKAYPDLEMLVHGGVNFAPYHAQFEKLLAGGKAELREVYPASEGFIAVADRNYNEGLRLIMDHGIFFEFVPLEELGQAQPTRHWAGNIQTDVNYAIVLSTCAGLWSYIIGDTVRFVDVETPRLLVTGRTSYYLSAFGEHLLPEEIEDAVSLAAAAINKTVNDYSVGPLYPSHPGELGGHLYIVEFAEADTNEADVTAFAAKLDARLSERNEDYEAHRAKGFGLNPPQITIVPKGTFSAWMKSRGKLGGQHKVPRVIMDRELFSSLRNFKVH